MYEFNERIVVGNTQAQLDSGKTVRRFRKMNHKKIECKTYQGNETEKWLYARTLPRKTATSNAPSMKPAKKKSSAYLENNIVALITQRQMGDESLIIAKEMIDVLIKVEG